MNYHDEFERATEYWTPCVICREPCQTEAFGEVGMCEDCRREALSD